MRLADLKDNMVVNARCGRAGRERVNWEEWKDETLYIQEHNGKIVVLTLRSRNWAEAGQSDLEDIDCDNSEGGVIVVEDWYLQIRNLQQ